MNRKISIHNNDVPQEKVTLIKPRSGWQPVDWGELMEYRDLFYFLVKRNIRVLYAQTVLGLSWAIMQPLIQIVLFTVIFGKVASVPTDGIPYFLFSTVAIIPWTYMSQSMNESSLTLVTNQGMLGKIYFPRIILPTVPILAKLLDFAISILLLVVAMLYYRVYPTINIIYVPFFLLYMTLVPLGIGLFLSALAIRYRDVKYAMTFIVRLLIYTAPVVYSASSIPEKYRLLYSLNPFSFIYSGEVPSFIFLKPYSRCNRGLQSCFSGWRYAMDVYSARIYFYNYSFVRGCYVFQANGACLCGCNINWPGMSF
jgi:lipopolysaccharide transport system permease protein